MRIVPPSVHGPSPCLTAFSTIVSSIIGESAQRHRHVDGEAQPAPHADLLHAR